MCIRDRHVSKNGKTLLVMIKEGLKGDLNKTFFYVREVGVIAFGAMLDGSNTIPSTTMLSGSELHQVKVKVVNALDSLQTFDLVTLQGKDGSNDLYRINQLAIGDVDKLSVTAEDRLRFLSPQ